MPKTYRPRKPPTPKVEETLAQLQAWARRFAKGLKHSKFYTLNAEGYEQLALGQEDPTQEQERTEP